VGFYKKRETGFLRVGVWLWVRLVSPKIKNKRKQQILWIWREKLEGVYHFFSKDTNNLHFTAYNFIFFHYYSNNSF